MAHALPPPHNSRSAHTDPPPSSSLTDIPPSEGSPDERRKVELLLYRNIKKRPPFGWCAAQCVKIRTAFQTNKGPFSALAMGRLSLVAQRAPPPCAYFRVLREKYSVRTPNSRDGHTCTLLAAL